MVLLSSGDVGDSVGSGPPAGDARSYWPSTPCGECRPQQSRECLDGINIQRLVRSVTIFARAIKETRIENNRPGTMEFFLNETQEWNGPEALSTV